MTDKKQDSGLDGREIPLMILIGGGALWYKYGFKVQVWFHENLTEIALVAIGLLILGGYLLVRKFNKKNEAEIARIKKLSHAKGTNNAPTDYYRRDSRKGVDL